MSRPTLTRDLAWAASTDAGNASMQKAGRTCWNDDDWEVARLAFDRLWPEWRDLGMTKEEYDRLMAA